MAMKLYNDVDIENIAYEIRKKYGARLPKEYVEVNYITSKKGARIATGVSGANDNLKIQLKFSNTGSVNYNAIFGNYSTEEENCTRLIFSNSSTTFLSYINTRASGGGVTTTSVVLGDVHVVEMTQGITIFDGVSATKAVTQGVNNNNEISLFSSNVGASASTRFETGMYYFKIYDNNILIRDFVPCYRKSDNVAGMFDMVNNVFYTPYNDVGYFEIGTEVYDKYKISEMADAIAQLNVINI